MRDISRENVGYWTLWVMEYRGGEWQGVRMCVISLAFEQNFVHKMDYRRLKITWTVDDP